MSSNHIVVNTYENEDREDPDADVDIFNIIQKVQDTVVHLEVDEELWRITQGSKRQAQWVVVCGTRSSMLAGLSCTKGVWYIYDWDTGSTILIW